MEKARVLVVDDSVVIRRMLTDILSMEPDIEVVGAAASASLALALIGFDPLRLTMISVALTVVIMPLVVLPFLVLMNDPTYVKDHTSGAFGNGLLAALTILAALMAVVVIPLEIMGG